MLGVVLSLAPRWRSGDRERALRIGSGVLLGGALLLVLVATFAIGNRLSGIDIDGRPVAVYSANTEPFASIRLELSNAESATGLVNVVGNVLLFAPLGFFGLLLSRQRVAVVVGLCMLLSAAIEVAQYYGHRVADIDDVILNSTGALIGATLAALARRTLLRAPLAGSVSAMSDG